MHDMCRVRWLMQVVSYTSFRKSKEVYKFVTLDPINLKNMVIMTYSKVILMFHKHIQLMLHVTAHWW
jgi:hypothetical protein